MDLTVKKNNIKWSSDFIVKQCKKTCGDGRYILYSLHILANKEKQFLVYK